MRRPRHLVLGLGLAGSVIVADQLSKWAMMAIMRPPRVIEVTAFFNLVVGWNRGVSFGLFNTDSPLNAWVLPVLALSIAAVLAIWLSRTDRRTIALGLGLIIGGAIGNVIDRLRFGAVFDYLDFHAFGFHWPAFNVADSAITIGAIILVADSLFVRSDIRKIPEETR
ncbi:MAG: signal peptidase II [Rhodospirillales bacterium]|nr:signal peptidase II [Rhodospirillales bacterium]